MAAAWAGLEEGSEENAPAVARVGLGASAPRAERGRLRRTPPGWLMVV
jgi:hypothetical protein